MAEKLVVRRRQTNAPVVTEATVVNEEPKQTEEVQVQPEATPAPTAESTETKPEVAEMQPRVGISRPTVSQAYLDEQKKKQEEEEIAIPDFFKGAEIKKLSGEEIKELSKQKPEPIRNAITIPAAALNRKGNEQNGTSGNIEVLDQVKSLGQRNNENKIDSDVAADVIGNMPVGKKLSEKQFFAEGHRDSVLHHNDIVENQTTNVTVLDIRDDSAFEDLLNGKIDEKDIIHDNEYAQAAARNVIASISSSYTIVLLHSGYQCTFNGLKWLGRSRLLTNPGNPYNQRKLIYETIYNQIQNMSGGNKPSLEKWLKMTSFLDTEPLLFGVYAATYPTPQTFSITCPECHNKMEVRTDPESITAVYDESARNQVLEIINSSQSTEDIIKNSALSKIERVPLQKRKSLVYVKEPSIADFLDILAMVSKDYNLYEKYGDVFEKTMYVEKIIIPDIAEYNRNQKIRFVEITNKELIAKFIANLENDEGEQLDQIITNHNKKYEVHFEIPSFKCNGLKKDENGNWTNEPCGQVIDKMPLDMETLLFHNLQGKKVNLEEEEQ